MPIGGIGPRIFYKKPHTTVCLPSNNVDSEGSSSSNEETENFAKESSTAKKKKIRKGCIVPVEESESSCDSDSDGESELCDNRTVCKKGVSNDKESGNSSDSSESRWGRSCVPESDLVIPESDRSGASSPVGSIASEIPSIKAIADISPSTPLSKTNRNNCVKSSTVKITTRAVNKTLKFSDRYADELPETRRPLQNQQVNRNILPRNVHSNLPFRMNLKRVNNLQAPSIKAGEHPGASRIRIGLSKNVKTKQVLSAQSVLAQNAAPCKLQLPSQKQGNEKVHNNDTSLGKENLGISTIVQTEENIHQNLEVPRPQVLAKRKRRLQPPADLTNMIETSDKEKNTEQIKKSKGKENTPASTGWKKRRGNNKAEFSPTPVSSMGVEASTASLELKQSSTPLQVNRLTRNSNAGLLKKQTIELQVPKKSLPQSVSNQDLKSKAVIKTGIGKQTTADPINAPQQEKEISMSRDFELVQTKAIVHINSAPAAPKVLAQRKRSLIPSADVLDRIETADEEKNAGHIQRSEDQSSPPSYQILNSSAVLEIDSDPGDAWWLENDFGDVELNDIPGPNAAINSRNSPADGDKIDSGTEQSMKQLVGTRSQKQRQNRTAKTTNQQKINEASSKSINSTKKSSLATSHGAKVLFQSDKDSRKQPRRRAQRKTYTENEIETPSDPDDEGLLMDDQGDNGLNNIPDPKRKNGPAEKKKQERVKGFRLDNQCWQGGDLQNPITSDESPVFTTPSQEKHPVDYFRHYFNDEILELIVHETNLYSIQEKTKPIDVSKEEILAFFGILIYMGVCQYPALVDYWTQPTRIPQVADVMSRRRFQDIHSSIHFHNNEEEGTDRLLKIRPLLNHMRKKCLEIEQESELSVDERMQKYKGTRAGNLRQYMPDKPSSKWGFKLFVLAGASGMTYDFIPYCGSNTFEEENLSEEVSGMGQGASAVISLCKNIREPSKTTVTFDNFYTSIHLIAYLRDQLNLKSLGTVKRSRTLDCPLTDAKKFLNQGRGSIESFIGKDNVVVLQWADNKAVCLASSYVGVEPVGTIKRYSKDHHAKIDVPCPQAVLQYNKSMGGVDLGDMFMALYSVPTKAKRWYFSLFGYTLELALTNSWLAYKRDCVLLGCHQTLKSSKEFRLQVSEALKAQVLRDKGRPSLDNSLRKKVVRRPMVSRPSDKLRTDSFNHWPEKTTKGRCRYCSSNIRLKCTKCDVRLCITQERNCFVQFHITQSGKLPVREEAEDGDDEADEHDCDDLDLEDFD